MDDWSWTSGLGEQTFGNGWFCARSDFTGWAQIPCALSSMFLVRAPTRRNASNTSCNARVIRLGSCSSNRAVSSTKLALVVETQLRYGDELCRWSGFPHVYFFTLVKLMNFARGVLLWQRRCCTRDQICDEDVLKCASGCWPRAPTNHGYSVTDVEGRLTSLPLVASADCSRCSQTWVVSRKICSEKKAKATSKQTKPSGHAREHE